MVVIGALRFLSQRNESDRDVFDAGFCCEQQIRGPHLYLLNPAVPKKILRP
jgi:hypothetical protein